MKMLDKLKKVFTLGVLFICTIVFSWSIMYTGYLAMEYYETKVKKENNCQYFQTYSVCKGY